MTETDLATGLRADLADANYTVEELEALLGTVASAALHREQTIPAFGRLLGDTSSASALAWVFILGQSIEPTRLDKALPRTGSVGLRRLGLIAADKADPGLVRAMVDLRPYGDDTRTWWVCSDLSELATGRPLEVNHVLGIGGASTTLAAWTPRPEVTSAADIGTGCGVQALHLSRHAERTVATDISTRAVAFARFNAALNGIDLDIRDGSMLEPIAGERFDLIVSNPPFVITPRTGGVPLYEYRDGGQQGDGVVADLVRDIGAHLNPGGIAHLLGNWETAADQDWRDRVAGWLDEAEVPLDAWIIQREVQDPAQYAETWARDGGQLPGQPEFTTLYSTWLADFARRGIDHIGFGIITLQRPLADRPTWREVEEIRGEVRPPLGAAILDGVRARTWLAEHDDDAVLNHAWNVAADVTEERIGRPGAHDPAVIQLRQGGGLQRTVRLTTEATAVVDTLDGDLTPAQIVPAVAALTDRDAGEVRAEVLPLLRRLIGDGFLLSEHSLS